MKPLSHALRHALAGLLCAAFATPALAWDGAGHRMITRVALRGLSQDMPAWLKDDPSVLAVADQAQVPDRWRGVRVAQLTHLNNPDHYLDIDDLPALGMTLRTMPRLRHEYVKQIALARAKPDFAGPPIDDKKDFAKTDEYPGFLPIAAMETYGKVVGAFKTLRMAEMLNKDGSRDAQIEAAKWNARVHLGQLSHFVGDASQPLHTTKHHHGWVGDNPNGYTTDRGIHAYIDGGVLKLHAISDADLSAKFDADRQLDRDDLFGQMLTHIERSFAHMEPLYQLQKAGDLEKDTGKTFIIERLADAASELSALIEAAWLDAAPSPEEVQNLIKFEGP
jgi:hypothetical protein